MRAFAAARPDEQILQQAVAQLPWGHITVLLDRLDDHELRNWYADQAAAPFRGAHAAAGGADELRGGAPAGGGLAQQITKDPYVLDFLALALALALAGDDFYVDLLFFHVEQLPYVVIELKTGKFKPEYVGQLGFYVALVDDKLRWPQHADTVGLLLVADKNDAVVRCSLGAHQTPHRCRQLRPPSHPRSAPPCHRKPTSQPH
jgi:predicted nuclease of restriction endonuclease-like (RecB) superfamily